MDRLGLDKQQELLTVTGSELRLFFPFQNLGHSQLVWGPLLNQRELSDQTHSQGLAQF